MMQLIISLLLIISSKNIIFSEYEDVLGEAWEVEQVEAIKRTKEIKRNEFMEIGRD